MCLCKWGPSLRWALVPGNTSGVPLEDGFVISNWGGLFNVHLRKGSGPRSHTCYEGALPLSYFPGSPCFCMNLSVCWGLDLNCRMGSPGKLNSTEAFPIFKSSLDDITNSIALPRARVLLCFLSTAPRAGMEIRPFSLGCLCRDSWLAVSPCRYFGCQVMTETMSGSRLLVSGTWAV